MFIVAMFMRGFNFIQCLIFVSFLDLGCPFALLLKKSLSCSSFSYNLLKSHWSLIGVVIVFREEELFYSLRTLSLLMSLCLQAIQPSQMFFFPLLQKYRFFSPFPVLPIIVSPFPTYFFEACALTTIFFSLDEANSQKDLERNTNLSKLEQCLNTILWESPFP